jgi:hypothetical protein
LGADPAITQYTFASCGLNPSSFVALIVPIECCVYMLKNAGPDTVYLRSDPNDPTTEDSMLAGCYEDLSALAHDFTHQHRYASGATLYWAKCTGPLIGKFWA